MTQVVQCVRAARNATSAVKHKEVHGMHGPSADGNARCAPIFTDQYGYSRDATSMCCPNVNIVLACRASAERRPPTVHSLGTFDVLRFAAVFLLYYAFSVPASGNTAPFSPSKC